MMSHRKIQKHRAKGGYQPDRYFFLIYDQTFDILVFWLMCVFYHVYLFFFAVTWSLAQTVRTKTGHLALILTEA
jgi:hypothetical protein